MDSTQLVRTIENGPYTYDPKLTPQLIHAAAILLYKIDNITTDDFSKGAERQERESLRHVLASMVKAEHDLV